MVARCIHFAHVHLFQSVAELIKDSVGLNHRRIDLPCMTDIKTQARLREPCEHGSQPRAHGFAESLRVSRAKAVASHV